MKIAVYSTLVKLFEDKLIEFRRKAGYAGENKMIKLGIIGAGGMAGERAKAFGKMASVQIVAVWSTEVTETKPLCETTGAKGYDNYSEALTEVDAVAICIPNSFHARFALQALAEGKHVLVEYPLCIAIDDANILQTQAADSGCVLMAGNTIVHEAMFNYLMTHKEKLGRIISASSRVALYDTKVADKWSMNPTYTGSTFAALHYHHIEYYRHFLGEIEWLLAKDERIGDETRSDYNSTVGGTLLMSHLGGATSCIQWYLNANGSGLPRGLWLNGSKSSVTIVSKEPGKSQIIWDDGGEGKLDIIEDEWGVSQSSNDFIKAIRGKMDHKARLTSDIATLKAGLAAQESATTGRIVRLNQKPD